MKTKKFKTALLISFLCYAILVSTHKGEFWPFSIFPMFSQAGNPWSRGVVQNIHDKDDTDIWKTQPLREIRDDVVSLEKLGVNPIDYANYVSKTKTWTDERIQGLRDVIQIQNYPHDQLMITRVRGKFIENDSIYVEAIPLFLITSDTTYRNPHMFGQ